MADVPLPRPRPELSFLERWQPAELGMFQGLMKDQQYQYPVTPAMRFTPRSPSDYPVEHPIGSEGPGRYPRMPGDRYSGMGQLPGFQELLPGDYRPGQTQLAGDVVPLRTGPAEQQVYQRLMTSPGMSAGSSGMTSINQMGGYNPMLDLMGVLGYPRGNPLIPPIRR